MWYILGSVCTVDPPSVFRFTCQNTAIHIDNISGVSQRYFEVLKGIARQL